MRNAFRLWVACRKTSNSEHIVGSDKLGCQPVEDPNSQHHNLVPVPKIMISQMECIMYSRVLRPISRKVVRDLNELVRRNKPHYWLTIYLTSFLLLHSCSMLTKRDHETALRYDLKVDEYMQRRYEPLLLSS